MIDIKAKAGVKDGKKKGVAVSCHSEGEALYVMEESIAIIRTIMENLKQVDNALHLIVLEEIYKNPGILTGEDSKEKIKQMLSLGGVKKTSMN